MAIDIQTIELRPYHRSAAATARVSGGSTVPAWHCRLSAANGAYGTGDIAPWPGFGESADTVHAALEKLCSEALCVRVKTLEDIHSWVKEVSSISCIRYGLELALLDLWTQLKRGKLYEILGEVTAPTVRVHRLVRTPNAVQL